MTFLLAEAAKHKWRDSYCTAPAVSRQGTHTSNSTGIPYLKALLKFLRVQSLTMMIMAYKFKGDTVLRALKRMH